jgi:hypothetical protein
MTDSLMTENHRQMTYIFRHFITSQILYRPWSVVYGPFEYSAGAKKTKIVNSSSIEWNRCSTFFATYTIDPVCTARSSSAATLILALPLTM